MNQNQGARQFLDAVCSVPNEAEAVHLESQWLRLTHGDLDVMTRVQQRRELYRCEQRLALEDDPDDEVLKWLTERQAFLREALSKRHVAA